MSSIHLLMLAAIAILPPSKDRNIMRKRYDDYLDTEVFCQLLNKDIHESYCEDINLAISSCISYNVLEDRINPDRAARICSKCRYRIYPK